jgi:hypothetical protein
MTTRDRNGALDRQVEEVRRLMREHRTAFDPGPYFVERVIASLPRGMVSTFAWAARWVLPVTLAVAAVLSVAVVDTTGSASRSAPAAVSATSQNGNDPLDWLLENGQGVR